MSAAPADAWGHLRRELDAWAEAGRVATFWWRDDDATAPTPALDRLLVAADGVPLALAAIPTGAGPALAARLAGTRTAVLQHGFAHANHAPAGARKAEFGPHRPLPVMAAELREGRDRLRALFGAQALPVLAPPWNRVAAEVAAMLTELGFGGLSTYGPRKKACSRPDPLPSPSAQAEGQGSPPVLAPDPPLSRGMTGKGRGMAGEGDEGGGPRLPTLRQANAHIDPIDWRGTRGFAGAAAALGAACRHLRARRLGEADPAEATGLLTHHLAMDEPGWAFAARFLAETRRHPAARWIGAEDLFAPAP